MSTNDIKKIKTELNNITIVDSLDYYDNPCLVILDAVMSRSRVYEKTVVLRLNTLKNTIQILIHLKS